MDDQVAEVVWNVSKLDTEWSGTMVLDATSWQSQVDRPSLYSWATPCGAAPTSSRVGLDELSVAILLVAGYSRSSEMPVDDDWMCWGLGSIVA